MPAELIFLSEYRQKGKDVLQKDRIPDCKTENTNSAAMVFVEAARLSYQLGH